MLCSALCCVCVCALCWAAEVVVCCTLLANDGPTPVASVCNWKLALDLWVGFQHAAQESFPIRASVLLSGEECWPCWPCRLAGWQQSRGIAATAWKYWSSSPLIIAQPELSRTVLAWDFDLIDLPCLT